MTTRHHNTGLLQFFLFLAVICGILIFGDTRHWWDAPRGFVEKKILRIRVEDTQNLAEKISQLEAQTHSLTTEKNRLTKENEDLRKQLQAPLPPHYSFIPGYVINMTVQEEDIIMTVAAGRLDGVETGFPVIFESTLIGTVIETTPRITTVRLLGSPKSKIAVVSSSGSHGIVMGEKVPTHAILDRVLQTESLLTEDQLITSGEDALPPNLLVGNVEDMVSEARDPFKRARVALAADPRAFRLVFIVNTN